LDFVPAAQIDFSMSTIALKKWIAEQIDAKHTPQALFESMLKSGWSVEQARRALEEVLGVPTEVAGAANVNTGAELPAVPVPEPTLGDYPTQIRTRDRTVDVLAVMKHPRVVVFGNLLSKEECTDLIALATPKMSRSRTVDRITGGEEVNDSRTSEGMFFQRGEGELVTRIEKRLADLINWPFENGEGLQILRYGPGNQYEPHNDYFDIKDPGTPSILARGGQRVGTIVMYLQSPEKGGGTVFPDVGFEVAPIAGNAVFFSYNKPHAVTKTLHGGQPIIQGEKWIATKWVRERVFI
jgi:prolyl 4-hydroxylase